MSDYAYYKYQNAGDEDCANQLRTQIDALQKEKAHTRDGSKKNKQLAEEIDALHKQFPQMAFDEKAAVTMIVEMVIDSDIQTAELRREEFMKHIDMKSYTTFAHGIAWNTAKVVTASVQAQWAGLVLLDAQEIAGENPLTLAALKQAYDQVYANLTERLLWNEWGSNRSTSQMHNTIDSLTLEATTQWLRHNQIGRTIERMLSAQNSAPAYVPEL